LTTRYELLDAAALARIAGEADRLLETAGVAVPDAAARDHLAAAGAWIDGERVRFPAGLARHLIQSSAPAAFRQVARNPARTVVFGGGEPVCAPVLGAPFVADRDSGARRYATLADFTAGARLIQATPALGHAGAGVCEATDRPDAMRHLDTLRVLLTCTDKPLMGAVRMPQQVADSLDMVRLVMGAERLERECGLLNLFNIESPLTIPAAVAGGIRLTAAAGQASLICAYTMMGMTAPVSPAAALVQMLAEVQAGAALAQAVRPGAPVILGIYAVPFSMQSMRPAFGAVESRLVMLAAGQLVHELGVPFRADGAVTSAKCVDAQAGADAADGTASAFLARADLVLHAAGWLDGGLVVDRDKWALDCALLARAGRRWTSAPDAFEGRVDDARSRPAVPLPGATAARLDAFVEARSAGGTDPG